MFLIVLTEIRLQRSFDDWQRTAFQSVVGAPDSSFSQGLQGLTAVAEKSTNMFARHGRGQERDREGTARYASFTLFSQDLGPWTSREHRFAFDELLSFISPAIRSEKWTIFGKAFRRSASRTMRPAQIQLRPGDDTRGECKTEEGFCGGHRHGAIIRPALR